MSDGWDGILDDDEVILWQGRPDGAVHFDFSDPMKHVMGVFFIAFSVIWMYGAAKNGGFFWIFGLTFLGTGLFNAGGRHFWKAYMLQNTHYSLSSKRAYIATDILGKKALKTYLIAADTSLEFYDGNTQTIIFSKTTRRGKNGNRTTSIGFERIQGGRKLLKLMHDMQQAQA